MIGAAIEKKLYDAALTGNATKFREEALKHADYLEEDDELLKMNPQLARSLDSKNSSPLHIAAAKGNLEITKKLLSVAPEMCWSRDCQNMNPIHIAAINGHVEILEELLQIDYLPAMERVHRGQTVLHLCVKHRQLMALKVLVEKLGELVYAKDDDGETIMHLAVRTKQLVIIKYLVEDNIIEKDTPNSAGKTALQILGQSPPRNTEIKSILSRLRADNGAWWFKASMMTTTVGAMGMMVAMGMMDLQATVDRLFWIAVKFVVLIVATVLVIIAWNCLRESDGYALVTNTTPASTTLELGATSSGKKKKSKKLV